MMEPFPQFFSFSLFLFEQSPHGSFSIQIWFVEIKNEKTNRGMKENDVVL